MIQLQTIVFVSFSNFMRTNWDTQKLIKLKFI